MTVNPNLMRQMQNRLAKLQEELATQTVEGSAGGGAVKVVMTGQQRVEGLTIDPSVVDQDDVEMLQDLVVAAFNDALARSQELASKRLGALAGGLNLPGRR